jgi:hypothetical protein
MATDTRTDGILRIYAEGIRLLTPENCRIFEGTFSLLHCMVKGDTLYRAVFAGRLFPIRHPSKYISLHYTDTDDKDKEIGVIEDLTTFPGDQQALVLKSLDAHYYEQVIQRVHDIRNEYGLLFLDVGTQRGREEFVMQWRYDRAEDYGEKGKVLLDAFDNRYIIRDVSALPAKDRSRFLKYIYW